MQRVVHQIEISHLFFADDTLIFCQLEEWMILNLWFGARVVEVLSCKSVKVPIKYLRLPLEAKYKDERELETLRLRCLRGLTGWKRNYLSKSGRLKLIKSKLINLPIYYLSILIVPVK